MVRKTTVLFMLLAIGSITYAQGPSTVDPNLSRLSEAVNAINENQLPRAERLLNSVLVSAPNDADALNLLGVVRAKQDRIPDAERLFRRALASLPSHVSAHVNLAELLLTHNRSTEAIPILLNAYKLAPSRPDINLNLARVYVAKSDYAQAYKYLAALHPESFTDEYFVLMLRSLVELKRLEEIRRLVPQFSSENPETQAEFATLLVRAGLHDEALKLLTGTQTKPYPVLYALGIAHVAAKEYDKAEEYLGSALTLKPNDVPTLLALAKLARVKGNLEKALSHLVQARKLAPNSPEVLYVFGTTALQMGLVLDALPVFERLHREYPSEPAYSYALAASHWTKGEVAETTRLMTSFVASQPQSASGWYLLGAALLRQEKTLDAQRALQRSLSLKADPDTEYLLGVSFEKAGDRPAAIERYRKVVQLRPDHAAAHAALGTAYRETGKYAEARVELERAVELDANDLRANYQLGLVYAKLGEQEAAKKMFDRADELRKRNREQETVIFKLVDQPQP